MPLDTIFSVANLMALVGWAVLLASPWISVWSDRIANLVIPMLLAIAYTGLVLSSWSNAEGGFSSLDEVALLFERREVLLAGWIHYLAFDLMVGAFEVRTARRIGLRFLFVVPCLAFTFLFGPAGFLLFCALRLTAAPNPTSARS